MAYTINLTDGTIFATIADGTINTSAQPVLTLVGKNYAGYGEFLDENFIRLLENGSNTTPPGAPLTGQLWWDSANSLMKVYNGTTFKTISSATASASQPTSNVTGDLWWDTTNQQLKAYNGSSFVLVGPASSAGQGTSGAIVDTVTDNVAVDHVVIKMYVNNVIVAIVSKDATFTPQVAITGFATIGPGIQLSSTVNNAVFNGDASNALLLGGVAASGFLSSTSNDTTTGTLGILNDTGLTVGADQDLKLSVVTGNAEVQIANQTSNANIAFRVNIAGTATTVMTINGSTGAISGNQINANYADVAERFAADYEYSPGTVVELGGTAEITQSVEELSENVFGVISTRAAYLMYSNAGTDLTHPPIAMTGRVPVQVTGSIRKGDRLVAAGNGMARAARPGEATAFNVIGRALHSKDDEATGTIEAIVNIN